jgi:hypothetical protein
MKEKVAVFVVGHEHWGKSRTLRELDQICDRQGRRITISSVEFFVRKTSNDDYPKRYQDFIGSISRPRFIAALCPKFRKLKHYGEDPQKVIDGTLQELRRRGYRLFFWVIEHKWNSPTEVVTHDEISELRNYGTVEVLTTVGMEAGQRARRFRRFLINVVLP